MSNGFVHSVKVPRLYKTAAKIVRSVREDGASLKSLVYGRKHPNVSGIYALTSTTLQKEAQLVQLFKETCILQLEPRLDPWLARILITELLWGKKCLQTECKPVQTVLSYESFIREAFEKLNNTMPASQDNAIVRKPRYVRVNTILISVEEAIQGFKEEGWSLLPKQLDYRSHLDVLKTLTKPHFMQDFHIPELLIFPYKTIFYDHDGYINGKILLQDKASCLPGYLLDPKPGSVVLDVCAAPGMKTTHLAAIMKNKGKIYAIEKNERRFENLCEQIETAGVKCVKSINEDILMIEEENCPNAEYALVDPSCSGSGILERKLMDSGFDNSTAERLRSLWGFQVYILRHVLLNFKSLKRVVYSTCSLNPEENEEVISQILNNVGDAYKLVSAKETFGENWINYSSPKYQCGGKCIYARPEVDISTGFFVAILERNFDVPLPKYKRKRNEETFAEHDKASHKRKKHSNKSKKEIAEEMQEEPDTDANSAVKNVNEVNKPVKMRESKLQEEPTIKKVKKSKYTDCTSP